MRRHELSPEQWGLIADLMPAPPPRGGGRWRDHRQVLNGLLWKLMTGAQWRDIPERYGPWQTVYERHTRWRDDGRLDRLLARLQVRLDAEGHIDPELWCVDSTHLRATRAAAGRPKRGAAEPADHALGLSRGGITTKILSRDRQPRHPARRPAEPRPAP